MSRKVRARYPQLAKEALVSSWNKGNPENRVLAKVIDVAIVFTGTYLLDWILPAFSWLVIVAVWSTIDSWSSGQSPGKWLLGLHTIDTNRAESPKLYNGFMRNLPLMLLNYSFLKLGHWATLAGILGMGACLMELYFIFKLRSGIRVGDVLAFTRVFDYKDEHTKFIEQFLKKDDLY